MGIPELKRIRPCCTVSGVGDSHRDVPFIAIASRAISNFLGCVPGVPRARVDKGSLEVRDPVLAHVSPSTWRAPWHAWKIG